MTPLALILLLTGQVPPFTARFEQVTASTGETDTACGTIYFAAPWRIYYLVDYPINQLISVVKNDMTIYYPDEALAFVITTKSPVESPMAQQSLPQADPAQTLTKMGFKRAAATTRGDTTFTNWVPKDRRNPFSRAVFGRIGRRTVFVEVLRQKGEPLMRTWLSGHIRADTFELPTHIVTERYDTEGRRTLENLTYTNLSTASDFLYDLGRFALPPGVRTRSYNW